MLFTELRFLPFFALVFLVHWSLSGASARKNWLLLCSYTFYAAWDWMFLSLILFSTGVDYVVGRKLAGETSRRRLWLLCSLVANLGLLGIFKYLNFFADSAAALLSFLGFQADHATLELVLPVGISFYTFQTLSYSIDVYRGRLEATKSLRDLALFVAFFPQLVAGPIVRASEFLPQLDRTPVFARVDVRAALSLFLLGFLKKACIADNLSVPVDEYFAAPEAFDAVSAWAATIFYAIQIYCDFSGYSDMAIACASLLGYRLVENFDAPYFATDIASFWRRWHISLSAWLRDYLYIPLGGNRGGSFATYRNLMITMLLGGLWHGAAWTFVLWGGLHGGALALHRLWSSSSAYRPLPAWLAMPITFYVVCCAWILFRADGLGTAEAVLRGFVVFEGGGAKSLGWSFTWLVGLFVCAHWLMHRYWRGLIARVPSPVFSLAYGVVAALALTFVPLNARPFLYFQF